LNTKFENISGKLGFAIACLKKKQIFQIWYIEADLTQPEAQETRFENKRHLYVTLKK